MSAHGYHAATQLLAAMLVGVSATRRAAGSDEPDASMSTIELDGDTAIQARIHTAPGDVFLVRIEWLKDESP